MPLKNGQPVSLTVREAARSTSTAVLALFTVLLMAVAVGGVFALHSAARADRRTQLAISDLGRDSNLLSSFEWQVRTLSGPDRATAHERVDKLAAELQRQEDQLLDSGSGGRSLRYGITLAAHYRRAVVAEIDAFIGGDVVRAAAIDDAIVDPTFDRLQPALDRVIRERDATAARSLRWADYGSIAFAFVILCALLVLMAAVNRQRRRQLEARAVIMHEQAHDDALTGLSNRRQLLADLDNAVDSGQRSLLALFDLDGFKAYNDAFGHVEGDLLLQRLASKLSAAVAPDGHAYRLGGDEFCVLWLDEREDQSTRLRVAAAALAERGDGFSIAAAHGAVTLPDEAKSSDAALRMADQRMYAHKRGRGIATKQQVRNVALRAIAEQADDLHCHVTEVARLATSLGVRMGIGGEELNDLTYAAELHDVGKIAIPDSILQKPGPLLPAEWEFMRRHTLIGEAILRAAPALGTVATYVRSSHERFDGEGYPDGLSGTEIPLASRVIFVCDSFSAMTQPRSYRTPMAVAEARAEVLRCAGSQFDAAVVAAFLDLLDAPVPITPEPPAVVAAA